MKHLIVLVLLTIFITSCKKETNQNLIDFRCGDFESQDCFRQNWVWGLNNMVKIVDEGYNNSKGLLIVTDSLHSNQNIYTYVSGFDSNAVYRLTFYVKYKKVSQHFQHQGHAIRLAMTDANLFYYAFNQNGNSNDPIAQEWIMHTVLLQSERDIPILFDIHVSGLDSVWIDDLQISRF